MALHHYVPQFYLKNFSISSKPDFVWVYRRDNQEPKDIHVSRIAAVKGFYRATSAETGEKTERIEGMFAEIEGEVAPIIKTLVSGNDIWLSNYQYEMLSIF